MASASDKSHPMRRPLLHLLESAETVNRAEWIGTLHWLCKLRPTQDAQLHAGKAVLRFIARLQLTVKWPDDLKKIQCFIDDIMLEAWE
eukprot:6382156-Amphidinium_carterae.2